jgi:uncharacterized protein (DUF1800 family)
MATFQLNTGTTSRLILCFSLLLGIAACNNQTQDEQQLSDQRTLTAPPEIGALSAKFTGLRSNYTILKSSSGYTVTDNIGSDGTVNIAITVTSLVFKDIQINLSIAEQSKLISDKDLASLIELYIAYFNRVPDANGLSYWIGRFQSGMSLEDIGKSFYDAALPYSTQTGYSANMSNGDFVNIVYKNVLGRATPDPEGYNYWTNSLNSGSETRGTLIRTMLNSAHSFKGRTDYGWVADLLDNKIEVGKEFSVTQGISYNDNTESVTKGMAIASSITPTDTSVAKNIVTSLIGLTPTAKDIPSAPQASRFLAQASFGATTADINTLTSIGLSSWIDSQFTKPQKSHRLYMDSIAATLPTGLAGLNQNQFFESFWQQAITGEDQLRQRVAYALSQILVISFQDSGVNNYPRGVAAYYDILATHAFGNYRNLLEQVSTNPMMGTYLTSLRNQKESGTRVPDENYAREVMQLFTIGLYQLNLDGSLQMSNGKAIETYTYADITGLAKVFTGWSWGGSDKSATRFFGGNPDPNRDWIPMQGYPTYHSTTEKKFLGATVPAQSTADPAASLKVALDTLFNHANVGPFISKQLIQRLVTSNPSPQYVARVASVFANNGQGVRGDMKAIIKAILLDVEARNDPNLNNVGAGKLREPVLRLAQWMRAFNVKSTTNRFLMTNLDDPVTSLGQTPMRSPTVFNFYRPGYAPPNSSLASVGLVSPEMQITGESSVVGYLNYMRDIIQNGAGSSRDIKPDYSSFSALASTPDQLVDRINLLLMANQMSSDLRNQILAAVNSVTIPTSSASAADAAKNNRVYLAIYLTMASPEYLVQK